MLSLRTQVQVVNFLQILIQAEEQVERARQHLAKLPSFEPYHAFRFLDQSGSGRISASDLMAFLSLRNCLISPTESALLLASLTTTDRTGLCYGDFIAAVLPWNNDHLRRLAIDQKGLSSIGKEAEFALCLFFEKELDLFAHGVEGRKQLERNQDFSIGDWFRCMDLDTDGEVSIADLKQFSARVGVYIRDADVKTAFQRLDKDRDGVLSLTDLQRSFAQILDHSGETYRNGSALLDSRSISPLKSTTQFAGSQRQVSPLLLSARRSGRETERKEITTSPRPMRRREGVATPSQSAETVTKSDHFPSKRLHFDEDFEAVSRAVLTYFRALLTLSMDHMSLKSSFAPLFFDILCLFSPSGAPISIKDFEKTCRNIGLSVTIGEIRELFERFDEDSDELLSEKELKVMVFGGFDGGKHTKRDDREPNFGSLEGMLGNVICGLIDVEKSRKRVFGAKLSDLYSVFRSFDLDQDGFIGRKDIEDRLKTTYRGEDVRGKFSFFDFLADITPSPLFRPVLL